VRLSRPNARPGVRCAAHVCFDQVVAELPVSQDEVPREAAVGAAAGDEGGWGRSMRAAAAGQAGACMAPRP
jgi:hypothetical protein